jgi:hypothetical protein
MPRPNKVAREKARYTLLFLSIVCTYDSNSSKVKAPWKLSTTAFSGASIDETPLDLIRYNASTRKYEYTEQTKKADKRRKEDDFILQAMVMLLLYRLEFGLGKQLAMQQLSIWQGTSKKPSHSKLPNLWEKDLKASKKQAGHIDNFYTFADCYQRNTNGPGHIWNRRSTSVRSVLHEFAEQSVVQWALELMKQKEFFDYPFLAANVIKIAAAESSAGASGDLAKLLYDAAVRSDHSTQRFSKLAMDMMTRDSSKEQPKSKRLKTAEHSSY